MSEPPDLLTHSVNEAGSLIAKRTAELRDVVKELTAALQKAGESSDRLGAAANRIATRLTWFTAVIALATAVGVLLTFWHGR